MAQEFFWNATKGQFGKKKTVVGILSRCLELLELRKIENKNKRERLIKIKGRDGRVDNAQALRVCGPLVRMGSNPIPGAIHFST